MPRINPTKLYSRLSKRDQMYFGASDATVARLSQMICGAARRTCTATVIRSEVDRIASKLRLIDLPPALRVPQATPASSDEERRDTRNVRVGIPPNEDIEQALVPPAADESKINAKVKGARRAKNDVTGEETDYDLRPTMNNTMPRGVDASEGVSPP